MWAFHNGKFIDADQPVIRLTDRGLTFGDGIFEVMRTVNGRLLFFDEHIQRMTHSLRFFGIRLPYTPREILDAAVELARMNAVTDGEVYIEVTRGIDPHREHRMPPSTIEPTFFMLAFPLRAIDPRNWVQGAQVITHPDLRHGLCEHKTLNLLANVLAKNAAYARGAYEALMFREDSRGRYATEGASSHFFCVLGEQIVTPAVENILDGITRKKILALAPQVRERRVYLDELKEAQEIFLVSTVSKVMPVRAIDETTWPAPGPITRELRSRFEEVFAREVGG